MVANELKVKGYIAHVEFKTGVEIQRMIHPSQLITFHILIHVFYCVK